MGIPSFNCQWIYLIYLLKPNGKGYLFNGISSWQTSTKPCQQGCRPLWAMGMCNDHLNCKHFNRGASLSTDVQVRGQSLSWHGGTTANSPSLRWKDSSRFIGSLLAHQCIQSMAISIFSPFKSSPFTWLCWFSSANSNSFSAETSPSTTIRQRHIFGWPLRQKVKNEAKDAHYVRVHAGVPWIKCSQKKTSVIYSPDFKLTCCLCAPTK